LRVLGGVDFRGSFEFFNFEFFFALLLGLPFFCYLLIFVVLLLLDDLLVFSCLFDLLPVLYGVLDSKFKLYAFCCKSTRQGGD
jgi:hypothetical protein